MRSRRGSLASCLCLIVCVTCLAQGPQRQRPSSSEAEPATPAATPAPTSASPAASSANQAPAGDRMAGEGRGEGRPAQEAKEPPEEKPIITHHEMRAGGKTLRYTATTGLMPIRDAAGKLEARMFFIAYTLD